MARTRNDFYSSGMRAIGHLVTMGIAIFPATIGIFGFPYAIQRDLWNPSHRVGDS